VPTGILQIPASFNKIRFDKLISTMLLQSPFWVEFSVVEVLMIRNKQHEKFILPVKYDSRKTNTAL
jgi:hypothetical protein